MQLVLILISDGDWLDNEKSNAEGWSMILMAVYIKVGGFILHWWFSTVCIFKTTHAAENRQAIYSKKVKVLVWKSTLRKVIWINLRSNEDITTGRQVVGATITKTGTGMGLGAINNRIAKARCPFKQLQYIWNTINSMERQTKMKLYQTFGVSSSIIRMQDMEDDNRWWREDQCVSNKMSKKGKEDQVARSHQQFLRKLG